METDEHLAEANVYVRELHNVLLLGCVSFCVDFSAFVVSITNTAPLVQKKKKKKILALTAFH